MGVTYSAVRRATTLVALALGSLVPGLLAAMPAEGSANAKSLTLERLYELPSLTSSVCDCVDRPR